MTDHITLPRSVVEQAIDALEDAQWIQEHRQDEEKRCDAIDALRAALASAAQAEPFGYVSEHHCAPPYQFQFNKTRAGVYTDNGGNARWSDIREAYDAMLNAAPTPPAATVPVLEPLTDEELVDGFKRKQIATRSPSSLFVAGVRFAEAAHAAKLAKLNGITPPAEGGAS